jgi:hypothetical protein
VITLQDAMKALDQMDLELDGGTDVGTVRIFLKSLTEKWAISYPGDLEKGWVQPLEEEKYARQWAEQTKDGGESRFIPVRRYVTGWENME